MVLQIFAPDGSGKPFLAKMHFFLKLQTRPKEALCRFLEKSVFAKKLEADSRIKAHLFFKPAAKLKKITRNSRRFPGYWDLIFWILFAFKSEIVVQALDRGQWICIFSSVLFVSVNNLDAFRSKRILLQRLQP